jgi:hypothetical protein
VRATSLAGELAGAGTFIAVLLRNGCLKEQQSDPLGPAFEQDKKETNSQRHPAIHHDSDRLMSHSRVSFFFVLFLKIGRPAMHSELSHPCIQI